MRRISSAAAAGLALLTGVATAAPVATLHEDVDGDGRPDTIELAASGVLTIGGKRGGKLTLATGATRGRIELAGHAGLALVVVDLTTAGAHEAVIIGFENGAWRELHRAPLGGVGLDADYGFEIDVTPAGIVRYQTRADIRRCDGKPAYLFAQGFDPRQKQFRMVVPPFAFEPNVISLTPRIDPAPASPPLMFKARAASTQAGVSSAGGLGIPAELDDGRPETAWTEDLGSDGRGQFFTFEPRVPGLAARQLRIVPVRATAGKPANRVRELAIGSAVGTWRVELPDAARERPGTAYTVDLPTAVPGCVTVVLVSTYGGASGQTAIAELEVFAEGERTGGGDAMLAKIVADGKDGATGAAAALARRGAAGATALDAEIAKTTDPAARRRLIGALVKIQDPAAGPALARAATEGWVTGPGLLDLVAALATNGLVQELAQLAGTSNVELEARIAAASRLGATPHELPLLIDLAGTGPRDLRRAVIERLALAPIDALIAAATAQADPAAAGDLWRAITRRARAHAADRPAALAAMAAALPAATDYERRYRLVDGIATIGDAAAVKALEATLRGLPAGAETAALRQVAIAAAGATPRAESIELVLAFTRDPDPGVRLAVLSALAGAAAEPGGPWHLGGRPDGIDRVIVTALSADTWPDVRRRAATALGTRCQRSGPAAALTSAVLTDKDVDVRGDALIALVQCRAPGTAQLLARVWDDGKAPLPLRTQAVGLAVALEDPQLGVILVGKFARWRGAAIESEAALVLAQSAAASIARLDAPGAAQALTDALDDAAFPEIVSAAALGLAELGPKCPPAAKAKLAALAASDEQSATAAKRAVTRCGRP